MVSNGVNELAEYENNLHELNEVYTETFNHFRKDNFTAKEYETIKRVIAKHIENNKAIISFYQTIKGEQNNSIVRDCEKEIIECTNILTKLNKITYEGTENNDK